MASKMTLNGIPRTSGPGGRKQPAYSKKRIRQQRAKDPNYTPPRPKRHAPDDEL